MHVYYSVMKQEEVLLFMLIVTYYSVAYVGIPQDQEQMLAC